MYQRILSTLLGNNLLLILIIFLGAFLRLFKIMEFPIQLNHDEITQLYDAISIAQTGRDIYGNFLPTIFPSVNDFKSPFYTYATAFTYLLLGGHEWIIRIPGVIFGILMIPAVYWFTLKLLKESRIALFASFFTAIAPFEIFFSRKSFENIAGIFFLLIGLSCLLSYIEKNDKVRWLYLGVFFSSLGMYTYFSHAIIIPLLLISLVVIYSKFFLHNIRKVAFAALFFIILISPLLLIIYTNPDARIRTKTVFIGQDPVLGEQLELNNVDGALGKLLDIKILAGYSFNRYLQQFDPMYLYGNGLDFTNETLIGVGPMLFCLFPFLIFGIIYLASKNSFSNERKFILSWVLLGMLPSGLTFEEHSPHRVIMVFTMLNIISAVGFFALGGFISRFQNKVRLVISGLVSIAIIFNLLFFLHIYFVNFPYEKSHTIQYPFKNVALFAWSEYENYDFIVFDPQFGTDAPIIGVGAHYYFAYYGNYQPAKFQQEYRLGNKPREVLFDKFSIRGVYWPDDKELKNALVIVSPWSVPLDLVDQSKIIKRFNFYDGTLAFYAVKL